MKKTLLATLVALNTLGIAPTALAASKADTRLTLDQLAAQLQAQQALLTQQQAMMQAQQAQIAELKSQIKQQESAVEAVAASATAASDAAASKASKTTIGGYGELHYSHLDTKGNDAASGADGDSLDLHRFVLFFGHQFSDTVKFHSEVEIEHALTGAGSSASGKTKPGEVELEQAYIDWQYAKNHALVSGLFLTPVGIINETHEPNTFYGVERNAVESKIIPATWWEGGVMVKGNIIDGLKYDFAVTSGLNVTDPDNAGKFKSLRDGRQKVAKAKAEDLAYTARLRYTAVPGLELGVAYQHQEDITQGNLTTCNTSRCGQASLIETHATYQIGDFGLRALYAEWDVEGAPFKAAGYDEQKGWYVEPSYKLTDKVGVFTRYSEYDNAAGSGDKKDTNFTRWEAGINYWLTPQVVFKADYQDESNPAANTVDAKGFNLGVGYSF